MKYAIFAAALLSSVSLASAEDWTKDGIPVFPAQVNSYVREMQKAADARDYEVYNEIVENGGCNADFLPVNIAAYCFRGADSNSLNAVSVGASSGGSE